MQGVDIGMRYRRRLGAADRWHDVDVDLLAVAAYRRGPLARQVFDLEAGTEIGDSRRRAALLNIAYWIAAAVNLALQSLGLLARCRHAPVGEGADGDAALAAVSL